MLCLLLTSICGSSVRVARRRCFFAEPFYHPRLSCSVLDLANKGVANLANCGLFVMDEADKLLSPEFQPLIEQVIAFLPRERQMLMFSATFPITGMLCCTYAHPHATE